MTKDIKHAYFHHCDKKKKTFLIHLAEQWKECFHFLVIYYLEIWLQFLTISREGTLSSNEENFIYEVYFLIKILIL